MSGMKVWIISQDVAADSTVHETSVVNPENTTIYVHKIIQNRHGNCNCGAGSNLWVCLPDQGDMLITTHFNHADGSPSVEQFDFSHPFVIGATEHMELGVYGTGNGGSMGGAAQIFYTLTA